MKKKTLLAISALVLSTTILAGCNIRFGINSRESKPNNLTEFIESVTTDGLNINNNSNNASTASYSEELHKSTSSEGIDNLDISILASEVTIKTIGGNDITLDCTGTSNIVKETKFDKSRGTIYIEEKGVNSFNMNGFNSPTRKVIIGIPESFKGNAIISCGAGTVAINDSSFESLNLKGGMGELTISNVYFDKLTLKQGMGETSISLNKKCGDMDISGGMGEFYLSLSEVGGNLTYSGGMGEATIDLPDNAPVKIITDTGLGDTDISATTSGENTYIFDLSVGIGSLTVK